jgi:hypothetical protein
MIENKNMVALRGWLLALVLVAFAVVISYFWPDRPIALFVHSLFSRNSRVLLEPVTYIPNPLIWVATITFLAMGVIRQCSRDKTEPDRVSERLRAPTYGELRHPRPRPRYA